MKEYCRHNANKNLKNNKVYREERISKEKNRKMQHLNRI